MTLKVLHVIPSVATIRGGPSQAVLEMVSALRGQEVEAEIVSTNDNGENLLVVPTNQKIQYQQVPVRFFSRFSPPVNTIREFAFSGQLTVWLRENLFRYDVIHVHAIFSYPSTVAMAIARRQGIPYIVRPLGQLCEWSLQQSSFKKILYLKLIEQTNLNHSRGLHLTSVQEKKEVDKLQLDCPKFVIPHGLKLLTPIQRARQRLRQSLNLPEDEPIILFLSRIHPKKGLAYLIPALAKLVEHRFTFILAGSGELAYELEIQALLQAACIQTRTILTGFIEGEHKDLLLQGADLFALTSHSENFGIAVLEALAAGLPALVTPGVALSAVVQSQGLGYVTELDSDAIATALEQHLLHPEKSRQMGQCAQQFIAENYTWDKIALSLIQTYKTILNREHA